MQDTFGRSISYVRLSVTDRCNCRCQYCMPADGVPMCTHSDLLSFEEMVEIVKAAASLGCTKVRITGGEPLVRRNIVELCRMVSHVEGITEVVMTTNATRLAPIAEDLRAAGVSRLNISLDTFRPERYHDITRTGTLDDALAGTAASRAAGFGPLKINCVLMGGVNDDEIPDFVALARDEPIQVRFIELMPMGECADWPRARFMSDDVVLERTPELQPCGMHGVAEVYRGPNYKGSVGLIRAVSHKFCSGCDRIRITSDGRLKPCLHSAQEVPLRGLHDQELVDALSTGILMKPAHHNLVPGVISSATPRDMNQIGG